MSLINLDRLVATQGSFIVNNTTAKTTSFVTLTSGSVALILG